MNDLVREGFDTIYDQLDQLVRVSSDNNAGEVKRLVSRMLVPSSSIASLAFPHVWNTALFPIMDKSADDIEAYSGRCNWYVLNGLDPDNWASGYESYAPVDVDGNVVSEREMFLRFYRRNELLELPFAYTGGELVTIEQALDREILELSNTNTRDIISYRGKPMIGMDFENYPRLTGVPFEAMFGIGKAVLRGLRPFRIAAPGTQPNKVLISLNAERGEYYPLGR
jgi:hypothetical protein